MNKDNVINIIVDQLVPGKPVEEINLSDSFTDDLGADSLDHINLIMAIESEFKIEIPDNEMHTIKTVGDLVGYLERANIINGELVNG